jgi:DNA repair photolyase
MQIPNQNVIPDASASYGLRPQSVLGQYDFLFTLNPTVGCFFGCRHCYSPRAVCKVHDAKREFFENVHVKITKPKLVKKDLKLFSTLPQRMKRVQINETSEYYLPRVMGFLKDNGHPDVMLDILDAFRQEWQAGNRWMLHILTKSPLILRHLAELKAMKEQVQREVSFATGDDSILRKIEFFTPTVRKRMDLVERLSKEGLFVRIMAMPFYGDAATLRALQKGTFDRGAQAFKKKS